jgi:hypothetical protein
MRREGQTYVTPSPREESRQEKNTRRAALFAVQQLDNFTFDLTTYKKQRQKPYIHNKQEHETKYTVDARHASQRERDFNNSKDRLVSLLLYVQCSCANLHTYMKMFTKCQSRENSNAKHTHTHTHGYILRMYAAVRANK